MHVLADANLRLDANAVDYVLIAVYFVLVLGIGFLARRSVNSSLDFFLSGRSMPAWVTGLAFMSANLGAVEIFGMTTNAAQYGVPMVHFYWIGAVPAMVFLGLVMMPFYYGSKARSVPEFMLRRFGPGAHWVNSVSFALAQVLIAGVNLFALATVVNVLLGWSLWLSIIVAAVIVLLYTTLGGLSAAIYNEVMQFFVIVTMLVPLVIIGLIRVGGWSGLVSKISQINHDPSNNAAAQLSSWPGTNIMGIDNATLSILGIIFGLGFVLSFGYWTTNFAEVQRALSAKSMSAARRTPLIAAFPKTLIVLAILIPGMVIAVLDPALAQCKAEIVGGMAKCSNGLSLNNSIEVIIKDVLPNGFLGIAIAGLMASFMAGMAANVSSFNTVFTYDIWQRYVVRDKPDGYYLRLGRVITVIAAVISVGTAFIASGSENIMTYLQTLFGFFNAPLFATFIIGMFWKKMTAKAGAASLVAGTLAAVLLWLLSKDILGVVPIGGGGQGGAFVEAIAAFVVGVAVAVIVTLFTKKREEAELVGLVWSLTPRDGLKHDATGENAGWYRKPALLGVSVLVLALALNIVFW